MDWIVCFWYHWDSSGLIRLDIRLLVYVLVGVGLIWELSVRLNFHMPTIPLWCPSKTRWPCFSHSCVWMWMFLCSHHHKSVLYILVPRTFVGGWCQETGLLNYACDLDRVEGNFFYMPHHWSLKIGCKLCPFHLDKPIFRQFYHYIFLRCEQESQRYIMAKYTTCK